MFCEIKSINEFGSFIGYASVFNVLDKYRDKIMPGAFLNSIANNNKIDLLWQHKDNLKIGEINFMKEDSTGLYIEGKIDLKREKGMFAYGMIKNKIIASLSIGFITQNSVFDYAKDVRYIYDLELIEVSIVSYPANIHACITYLYPESSSEFATKR